jgi:hypothetical protein
MRTATIVIACVLVATCSVSAFAISIALDPAAMAGWKGTANFLATDGSDTLNVDIEYAVYNLGAYPGSDPSGGSELVYAYQIFSDTDAASVNVTNFSVGLIAGAPHDNINDDPGYGVLGGDAPTSAAFTATSAAWSFLSNTIDAGEHSTVLIFTSLGIPIMDSAQVDNSGISAIALLPTPTDTLIPEPSIMLIGLGIAALVGRRKRK